MKLSGKTLLALLTSSQVPYELLAYVLSFSSCFFFSKDIYVTLCASSVTY